MKRGTWIGLTAALALVVVALVAVARRGSDAAAPASTAAVPLPPPPGPSASPEEWMRRIEGVGDRRDADALEALASAAKSAPEPARRAALDRLAPAESKPAADLLVVLGKTGSPELLAALVDAIAEHGGPEAKRALEEVIRRDLKGPLVAPAQRAAARIATREEVRRRTRPPR